MKWMTYSLMRELANQIKSSISRLDVVYKHMLLCSLYHADLSTNRIVCTNISLKWYPYRALLHLRKILLLWKEFSAHLNTRHKSNTFPDISHLFYKNVLNDIDETFLQLFRWLSWIYSLVQSYHLPKFCFRFCEQLIQTFV